MFSLHCHPESKLTGSTLSNLIKRAQSLNRAYLAVADNGHLSSSLKAYGQIKKAGLKPILGLEVYFKDPSCPFVSNTETDRCKYFTLTLYSQDQASYQELVKMVSRTDLPTIDIYEEKQYLWGWKELEHISKFNTYIVLSGVHDIVGKSFLAGRPDIGEKILIRLKELFGSRLSVAILAEPWSKTFSKVVEIQYLDGTKDSLLSSDKVSTDCARSMEAKDLTKEFSRHTKIKTKTIGMMNYEVNKDIKSATLHKGFLPLPGGDVSLKVNKFLSALSNKHNINLLVTDYAYYANKEDKIVQTMKLDGHKIQPNFHMKTEEEIKAYLVNIMYINEDKVKYIIQNNDNWANQFDGFKLEYSMQLVQYDGDPSRKAMEFIHKKGRMRWDDLIWVNRLKEELNVIAKNPIKNLLPYFFPIIEINEFCNKNNTLTGVARGCLTGDTKIYTNNGLKFLKDVNIGDMVISHKGIYKNVVYTMVYPISEPLLEIRSEFSWEPIKLTKDHKLFGIKSEFTDKYQKYLDSDAKWKFKLKKFKNVDFSKLCWDRADNFSKNDYLFTPWIKNRKIKYFDNIDLSNFYTNKITSIDDKYVYYDMPKNNEFSIREIHKITKLSRNFLSALKHEKSTEYKHKRTIQILSDYLSKFNISIEEWINLDNTIKYKSKRWFVFDHISLSIIGRWIGDGWITSNKSKWGIAFHEDDVDGQQELINFLDLYNLPYSRIKHASKKLIQIIVNRKMMNNLFNHLFPDYKYQSSSKYIGDFIYLEDDLLRTLIIGLSMADGHIKRMGIQKRGLPKETIDTTSRRMASELKESLLYLKIPSAVYVRKPYIHKTQQYLCNISYKVRFSGLRVERSKYFIENEDGYFSKILGIKEFYENKVYDIAVENDHSYLTTNYIVHNSAGGSLLCYLMGVTNLNPMKYDLNFSRFLSLDRIKNGDWPDVDQDYSSKSSLISEDGRSGFLIEKYGSGIAQIGTKSTIRLKSAIKDVNRHFNGEVESEIEVLTKSLPPPPQGISDEKFVFGYEDDEGNHITGLLEQSEELQKYIQKRPNEWDLVQKTLGIIRSQSVHACATVLSSFPIVDHIPLRDGFITQYEAKEVESAGLLKYDFLTVSQIKDIEICLKLINQKHNDVLEIGYFNHNGEKSYIWDLPEEINVFKTIWNGNTTSIFQLHTSSMIPFVKDILPKSIKDLSDILALVRPGTLDYIFEETGRNAAEEYVARRNGISKSDFPELYSVIPETYGIIVYQEQQLKIAKELGDMASDQAEALRRLFAKKKKIEALEMKPIFMKTAINKIGEEKANKIWDMMETFARYSFNCSHSTSYSIIAYACMYLRYHYPLEWWAAILTNAEQNEISGTLWPHVKDIVSPPDINLSTDTMVIDYKTRTLRSKLGVIYGLGEKTIDPIVKGRPYKDIQDFVNKRVVGDSLAHKLIHVGILDSLFPQNFNLLEKLKLYQQAVQNKIFADKVKEAKEKGKKIRALAPKEGIVPEEYVGLHEIKDAAMRKTILPSLPIDLYSLGSKYSKVLDSFSDKIALTSNNRHRTMLINGESLRRLDGLEGSKVEEDIYIAATCFIVEAKEFTYAQNTKRALKLKIDTDGYISEKVLWPEYQTGKLVYPTTLKKGVIASIFFKKRAGKKDLNITEIVVESEF